jgi:hypothetical protein
MSYTPTYENSSLAPQQYDAPYSYYQPTETVRHTPLSLGWSRGTELVKLYRFIVPAKGKLPYFELLEKFTPTYETPSRVYLDDSK